MKKFCMLALMAMILSASAFADKVVYSTIGSFEGGILVLNLENDKSIEAARTVATSLYLYHCAEKKLSSSVKKNQDFKLPKGENTPSSNKSEVSNYVILIRVYDDVRVAAASYNKNESIPYRVEALEYSEGGYYSKKLPEYYEQALDEIKTWIEDR